MVTIIPGDITKDEYYVPSGPVEPGYFYVNCLGQADCLYDGNTGLPVPSQIGVNAHKSIMKAIEHEY